VRRAPLIAFCLAVVVLWPSLVLFVHGELAGAAMAQRAAVALVGAALGVRLLAAAMTSTRVAPQQASEPAADAAATPPGRRSTDERVSAAPRA
jgi:hypothetical protein